MVLRSTLEYIAQPLETADINVLRNAVICGVTALVMVMVGLSKLLVLVFYLLLIGLIAVVTWLYSLGRIKRHMVIERIKEVFNSLMQTCVDQVLNEPVGRNSSTLLSDSPTETVGSETNDGGDAIVSGDRSGEAEPMTVPVDQNTDIDYSDLFE